jgi:hypothetical protein
MVSPAAIAGGRDENAIRDTMHPGQHLASQPAQLTAVALARPG